MVVGTHATTDHHGNMLQYEQDVRVVSRQFYVHKIKKNEILSRRKIPTVITLQGQSTISYTEVNHLSEIFQGACAIVHILLLFRLNRILPHYLTDGKIFRKTLLNIECVF